MRPIDGHIPQSPAGHDGGGGGSNGGFGVLARLALAILLDAIAILEAVQRRPSTHHRRQAQEVVEWIRDGDEEWIFSFRNVCNAIDLHPRRVLKVLEVRGLLP